MLFKKKKVNVNLYINFGNDEIKRYNLKIEKGSNVFGVLKSIAEVEYFPDEFESGHEGAMVISINDVKSSIDHCWIYYIFNDKDMCWILPRVMSDKFKIEKDIRIGWRFYNCIEEGLIPEYGPLKQKSCATKVKRCSHKF
jgi:hypothetical protein